MDGTRILRFFHTNFAQTDGQTDEWTDGRKKVILIPINMKSISFLYVVTLAQPISQFW